MIGYATLEDTTHRRMHFYDVKTSLKKGISISFLAHTGLALWLLSSFSLEKNQRDLELIPVEIVYESETDGIYDPNMSVGQQNTILDPTLGREPHYAEKMPPTNLKPEEEVVSDTPLPPQDRQEPLNDKPESLDDMLAKIKKSLDNTSKKLDATNKDLNATSAMTSELNLALKLANGEDAQELYVNHYPSGERSQVTYEEFFRLYASGFLLRNSKENPFRHVLCEQSNKDVEGVVYLSVTFLDDSTFQIETGRLFEGFTDPTGSIADYYQRLMDKLPKKFMPPSVAGLKAPFRFHYFITNPAFVFPDRYCP